MYSTFPYDCDDRHSASITTILRCKLMTKWCQGMSNTAQRPSVIDRPLSHGNLWPCFASNDYLILCLNQAAIVPIAVKENPDGFLISFFLTVRFDLRQFGGEHVNFNRPLQRLCQDKQLGFARPFAEKLHSCQIGKPFLLNSPMQFFPVHCQMPHRQSTKFLDGVLSIQLRNNTMSLNPSSKKQKTRQYEMKGFDIQKTIGVDSKILKLCVMNRRRRLLTSTSKSKSNKINWN